MPHRLPDLPYPADALAPHMSSETLALHHGKHHATYVDKLNALIEGTEFADAALSDIVAQAQGGIFNNAAQAWNHAFFWNCLRPDGGRDRPGLRRRRCLAEGILESCGNAGNPITDGKRPILTCDMWEHAYYVDYRNQKQDYIDAFWHLGNWDFAADNFDRDSPFEP